MTNQTSTAPELLEENEIAGMNDIFTFRIPYSDFSQEAEIKRGIKFSFNLEPTIYSLPINNRFELFEVGTMTSGSISLAVMPRQTLEMAFRVGNPLYSDYRGGYITEPSISKLRKSTVYRSASIGDEPPREMYERLYALLLNTKYDPSEIGDDIFEINLRNAVLQGGKRAIYFIDLLIQKEDIQPEVIFNTLRFIGRIKDQEIHRSSLRLLERHLDNSSRWVRDGAALGLASLEDVSALPILREAIEKEPIPDLKKDLRRVVRYLESLEK